MPFLRAGFNRRFSIVCGALALHRGWRGPAYLLRFRPSGDLAWLYADGLHWNPPALLCDLVDGPPVHVGLPQSRIPLS